jgi:hypothetical protein
MQEDERCCGTGTCIIDANGLCWCGQQWDGEQMCRPPLTQFTPLSEQNQESTAEAEPVPGQANAD